MDGGVLFYVPQNPGEHKPCVVSAFAASMFLVSAK
jgi:hypothetical protein